VTFVQTRRKNLEKMGEVTTKSTNNLILVTNIAPQATRDQMNTLFSFVGRVEELKLYPSVRDASINIECRCCFVRFSDPSSVPITQHLNNTVFIDRAVIVTPVIDNVIPDETMGIILSQRVQTQQQQTGGGGVVGVKGDSGEIEGPATAELAGIADAGEFQDPRLEAAGLPPYPALPPDTAAFLVNEVRRTVVVINVDSTISAQQCMEFFSAEAGEVKFFRYCTRNNDPLKYALIEFSERTSVVPAMLMSGRQLGNSVITVTHAIEAIAKPQAKSNEAAQREIEEAMTKVKEAQSLVSAAVDPLMGMLGGTASAGTTARSSRTRSRSRSRSRRRSRSRGKSSYSSRRSRSRDRDSRRRSRSRERRRRSRSRDRHRRSRSRDSRRKRSKSRDRHRRPRSKSRDRDRKSQRKEEEPSKKDEVKKEDIAKEEELRAKLIAKEESRKEDRDKEDRDKNDREKRDRDKEDRTKDRDRDRDDKDRKRRRSRSKDRTRRRSRSKERRRRSRSRDRKRSRSRERSKKQSSSNREVKRDYDQEEKGFEQKKEKSPPKESVNTETQDMDISNSP